MGDGETGASASAESTLEYHTSKFEILTVCRESGHRTVADGQFDWGGRLLKSNGGVQRFPQHGWKPCVRVQRHKGA